MRKHDFSPETSCNEELTELGVMLQEARQEAIKEVIEILKREKRASESWQFDNREEMKECSDCLCEGEGGACDCHLSGEWIHQGEIHAYKNIIKELEKGGEVSDFAASSGKSPDSHITPQKKGTPKPETGAVCGNGMCPYVPCVNFPKCGHGKPKGEKVK
jgi:hypothetical protein